MSGIWFTSCKTSHSIESQKQIDYSGDFLYLRNLIESLQLDVNKQTKVTTDKLSDLKIENKTVYLSLPDSTGKQYLPPLPNRSKNGVKLMKHYPLLCSSSRIDLIL